MTLTEFQQKLYKELEERQQNAIADILIKIKNSPYQYNKLKYQEIEDSITPLSMSLLAKQLVESTKILIHTLAPAQEDKLTEYQRISHKISHNRGIGTTGVLLDKTVADLEERELLRLFQQERVINELESNGIDLYDTTVHQRLVALSLADNGHLFKGTFLCLGKRNQVSNLHYTAGESKFTHYKGTERSFILSMEDVKGCLIQQYERMMQLLRTNIPLSRDRNRNEDEYEIPMVAIRELVANAFVHRDYGQEVKSFIQIELYDDRLEIKSPGQLPEELNLVNIEGTLLINPTIMAVFHLYKYVEKRGSGITQAQAALREKGLEMAKIENIPSPAIVKVTIYRKQTQNLPKLSPEKQKQIAQLLQKNELVGLFALLDEEGMSDNTYQRLKSIFITEQIDLHFIAQIQAYLKNILPNPENIQVNPKSQEAYHFKNLIVKGKLQQALIELLAATEGTDLQNALILLNNRYNKNEKQQNLGTISFAEYQLEHNKIGAALLHFIDEYANL
ncbi:MAG: hypothetical protein K1X92_17685 [Bacteroidia bacterium]|nr:hypothetical protein [Bacteroidia bacterium]